MGLARISARRAAGAPPVLRDAGRLPAVNFGTFRKYHGLGNDYLVPLEQDRCSPEEIDAATVRLVCDVHYGLGSDGKQHYFAVGTDVRGPGITIWQSDDLVNWKDAGRVFTRENKPAILENGGSGFAYTFRTVEVGDNGAYRLLDTPAQGNNRLGNAFWAPCIYYHVYDQTYYLYYCCSAFGVRNSFIGCAKSKTLDKGWTDCGVLIHTRVGDGRRFNAIDPAVIMGENTRRVWMVYGSYFGGIALVELDPKDPSKLLHPGTHGKTVASRTTLTTPGPRPRRAAGKKKGDRR